MPFTKEKIILYFESEAAESWKKIKHNFSLKNHEKSVEEKKTLKDLVDYRDIIDYKLYCEAIEKIFPNYNLRKDVNGHITEGHFGHRYFKTYSYEFEVWPRGIDRLKGNCLILIMTADCRTLTSDIERSIITWVNGDARLLFARAHSRVREGGLDYEGKVTNAIIDYFYRGSEREFKKTSSVHRNSHVYADLMLQEKKRGEYPKLEEEENNPLVDGKQRLFSAEIWQEMQQQFKRQKHQLELAASLFSLRSALTEDGWQTFTKQVEMQLEEINEKFIKNVTSRKAFDEQVKKDIKVIFTETQALWMNYEYALVNTISSLETGKDGYVPEPKKKREVENCKIAALNRLYVEYLEKWSYVTGKMKALVVKREGQRQRLKSLTTKLQKAEKMLAHYQTEPHRYQIHREETNCTLLRTSHQECIAVLQSNCKELAILALEKLKWRYQAHTFAHGAYVCRSAAYQAAVGKQNQASVFSEQTILSSTLQQIGFKLLHRQELKKLFLSNDHYFLESRVACKTARYSQQLHQLLFNKHPVDDEEIRRALKKPLEENSLDIFAGFKSDMGKHFLFNLFSEEELTYLNCEIRMITLKNDVSLSETERNKREQQLLDEWTDKQQSTLTVEELFLSLASKLMAGVYLSKFTRQQRIWGEPKLALPQALPEAAPLLAITPGFEVSKAAMSEKKEDISTQSQEKPKHGLDSLKRSQNDMKVERADDSSTIVLVDNLARAAGKITLQYIEPSRQEKPSKQKDGSSSRKSEESALSLVPVGFLPPELLHIQNVSAKETGVKQSAFVEMLSVEPEEMIYVGETHVWEKIKQQFLLEEAKTSHSGGKTVNWIKYREVIEYKLYYDAVMKVFPNHYLQQKSIHGVMPVNCFDPSYFRTPWYEFLVRPHEADYFQASCRIRISAPGSCTLISNIETSIMTWVQGDTTLLFVGADSRVRKGGVDYEGNVTSAIIDYFYRGSEREFKMTSNLHRNSKVYAELMEEEEQRGEYPKFGEEATNPLIDGEHRLFSTEAWQEMQQQFKQQKHRLELAASLFSLRVALKEEGWQAFTRQVEVQLKKVKEGFIEEEASRKAFDEHAREDIRAVFAETQALWTRHEQALANKVSLLKKGEEDYFSELEGKNEVRNCEIAALNRLYVAYLEKRNVVTGKIKALAALNQRLLKEAKSLLAELQETKAALPHYQAASSQEPAYDKPAQIQKWEASCASLRTTHQEHIDLLQNNYKELAKLALEKLKLRYQAHSFGHHTNVCRSAAYQAVVEKQNENQNFFFSEQTLLSSALQQIGLKLLRKQEMEEVLCYFPSNSFLESQAAYATAKYSQQLFRLLFSKLPVNGEEISRALTNPLERNTLGILAGLKSDLGKRFLFKLFSEDELTYLHCEIRMITLKNDVAFSEAERYESAHRFLNEWRDKQQSTLTPKELLLSLVSKLMVGVYLSKFTRQQRIWGEPKLPSADGLAELKKQIRQLQLLISDDKEEVIAKYFENGEFQEALRQYEYITEDQLSLAMQHQKAEILTALGEFEKVENHINKVLRDFPKDAALWECKGLLYLMQSNSQLANDIFRHAGTLASNPMRILIYQGYSLLYENNTHEARECFRAVVTLGYKNNPLEQALLLQAKSFLEKENKESADKFQSEAFKIASSASISHQLQFYFLTGLLFEQMVYSCEPTEEKLKRKLKEKAGDAFYLCIQAFTHFKPALKKLLKDKGYENLNQISIPFNQLKEEDYLGCGTYGEVHRGEWLNREVAIKRMSLGKLSKSAFLQFAQEAHIFNKFKHPNIVRYLGVSIDKKPYRLVMEYLGKISLTDYIHNKLARPFISWLAKMQVMEGIAEGLVFLHKNGIFHRDLKPDNILLDQNDCPKLIDFGLSKIKHETERYSSISPSKSISNQHVGTIPYMAPEVLRAKDEEERKRIDFDKADVFSYGMIMWELAGRKKPWKKLTSNKIIENVGHKKGQSRELIDNNWPPIYTALMQACWEEDTMKRYPAQTVLITLKEARQAMPANSSHDGHNGSLTEDNAHKLNF